MTLYTNVEFPTISELTLPYATVAVVILDEGSSATAVSQVGSSAIAGTGFNPPVPGSQPSPLEIDCYINVKDLLCTGAKSLMLNEKFRPHIKIHLVETIDGFSSETVFGIDPAFDLFQLRSQNGYIINHKTQYPFLRPQNMEYRAWVELDINSIILDYRAEGVTPTNVSETGTYTSAKSVQEIIINGNVQDAIFDYQTSENAGHKHVYIGRANETKKVCSPPDANGNVVCHQHNVIDTEVQSAQGAMGPHVHYLIPMTHVRDLRDLSVGRALPIPLGGGGTSGNNPSPHPLGTGRSTSNPQPPPTTTGPQPPPPSTTAGNLTPPSPRPINLFSDFYTSRDRDGSIRFFFGVDMKKILSEHSVFGQLYERSLSYNHIMERSPPPISSMKIFRTRLAGSGETGSKKANSNSSVVFGSSKDEQFDKNEFEELVVQTEQKLSDLKIKSIRYDNDSPFRSLIGCSIEENTINAASDTGVRYFSGIDKTISQKTDGLYKYRLEIDIQDTVNKVINFHAATITSDMDVLKEYYNYALNAPSAIKNPYGNPHKNKSDDYVKERVKKDYSTSNDSETRTSRNNIASVTSTSKKEQLAVSGHKNALHSKKYVKGQYVPRGFNALTNQFSPSFKKNLRWSNPSAGHGVSDELINILNRFITIEDFYSMTPLSDQQFERRLSSLMNIISPVGGSPEGILSVISLMKDRKKQISSIIDIYTKPDDKNTGAANSTTSKSHVEGGDRKKMTIIKVENVFSYVCDASDKNDIGMDFMALGADENLGLKRVNRDLYRKVITREVSKLFESETANVGVEGYDEQDTAVTSMFSYLTPTKININPAIDLTVANSNKAADASDKKYKAVGKASLFYNAGRKNKTKSSAYQSYVVKKQDSAKKDPPYSNANQPMNDKEQKMISQEIDIKSEIEDANTSSQWLSENLGIQVVNKQSSESSSDSPPKTSTTTKPTIDSDKTKNYIENDLGKGNQTKANRSAKDIMDKILDQESDKKPKKVKDYNLTSGDSKIKQSFDNQKVHQNPTDLIKNLPNPVKVLVKSTSSDYPPNKSGGIKKEVTKVLSEDVNPENENTFRYKFQQIVEVQILEGYEKSSKERSLMLPKWKKLTKEVYRETLGKNLVCRIIPYENKVMGIERDKNYDLPTYDEYFILEGS